MTDPSSSSTTARSTRSSSPGACARRRCTPRSSRTPTTVDEHARQGPGGDRAVRRPVERLRRRRAAASTRRCSTPGVPVFGICYGFQLMAGALGGIVEHTGAREYGRTELSVTRARAPARRPARRAPGVDEPRRRRHARRPRASRSPRPSPGAPVAAFEDVARRFAGVQYHPEVGHSPHGQEVLRRFLRDVAGVDADWNTANIVDETVDAIRAQIGPDGRADLRPVRRRRLRGGRGAGAAGDRRPPHLRVRRPRPAARG